MIIFLLDTIIFKSKVFDVDLTDHCMLGLKIEIPNLQNQSSSVSDMNRKSFFFKVDFDKVLLKLNDIDWRESLAPHNVRKKLKLFFKYFK